MKASRKFRRRFAGSSRPPADEARFRELRDDVVTSLPIGAPVETALEARRAVDAIKEKVAAALFERGFAEPGARIWLRSGESCVVSYGAALSLGKLAGASFDDARAGYFRLLHGLCEYPDVVMIVNYAESWAARGEPGKSRGKVRDRADKYSVIMLTFEHVAVGRETYVGLIEGPEQGGRGRKIAEWQLLPGAHGNATHYLPRVRGDAASS